MTQDIYLLNSLENIILSYLTQLKQQSIDFSHIKHHTPQTLVYMPIKILNNLSNSIIFKLQAQTSSELQ